MNPNKRIALSLLTTLALAAPVFATSQTTAPPEKDKNIVVQSKDVVVKDAKAVAGATKDGLSKTGEVMTDTWITTRVAARFVEEPLLKDSNITVETSDRVVTLKGTVASSAAKKSAMTIAGGTEGVLRVADQVVVKTK